MEIIVKKQAKQKIEVEVSEKTSKHEIKKDMFNNRNVEKSDLIMNVAEAFDMQTGEKILSTDAIYADSWYIDSSGDLIKTAYIDGQKCILVELCDTSLAEIDALCNLNIIDDEKHIRNTTQRVRVNIDNTDIDICQMTLGTYRNYIEDKSNFDALNVKQKRIAIPKLDSEGKIIPKSFTYESRILCSLENKDKVIQLIRQLNKPIIEWF